MVILWHFSDAPEKYKNLSCHGGDEDYVILVPKQMDSEDGAWYIVERLTVCDFQSFDVEEDGEQFVVYITAYA